MKLQPQTVVDIIRRAHVAGLICGYILLVSAILDGHPDLPEGNGGLLHRSPVVGLHLIAGLITLLPGWRLAERLVFPCSDSVRRFALAGAYALPVLAAILVLAIIGADTSRVTFNYLLVTTIPGALSIPLGLSALRRLDAN